MIEAFVTLVFKLSEAQFKPMLLQVSSLQLVLLSCFFLHAFMVSFIDTDVPNFCINLNFDATVKKLYMGAS